MNAITEPGFKVRTFLSGFSQLLLLLLVSLLYHPVGDAAHAADASGHAAMNGIPAPADLFQQHLLPASSPDEILNAMLGIPYRVDGAVDTDGNYTLFADQAKRFTSPGLNCSGFVLQASRYLLKRNFTLDEVKRDRLGDSGPASPYGQDWDFGWDLIMNISEPFPRVMLLPGGVNADPATSTGFGPRGFAVQDDATWDELRSRLQPGWLYLVSFSVEGRTKGYAMQHYHVGLIRLDAHGRAWYYHTTGKGTKVNRRDLFTTQGRESFKKAFATTRGKPKSMLIIGVQTP